MSLHSEIFRRLWADHHVQAHTTGIKRLHHPVVGDLTLDFVVLAVEGDPDPLHPRAELPIRRSPRHLAVNLLVMGLA
ncbi:MmyB family transcriptional regulator [Streptomyces sp. NPDC054813]